MQRIDPTTGFVADSAFGGGRLLRGVLLVMAFGSALAVAMAVAGRLPAQYDDGLDEPDTVELRDPVWQHAILRAGDYPIRPEHEWRPARRTRMTSRPARRCTAAPRCARTPSCSIASAEGERPPSVAGAAPSWQNPRPAMADDGLSATSSHNGSAPPATVAPAAQSPDTDLAAAHELAAARDEIQGEIRKRIIGQQEVVDQLLTALFARGHCLFVGVPGLAKTLLISTLAEVLDLSFSRIQFTPDLMPSDITGTDILEEDHSTGRRAFRFIKGPVFAHIVLADEINRTPPKTQAALLQSMQELRVTAGGTTHELPPPFLVFATQNPIEQEGTYPLPEAQLDRFMFQIDVGYPGEADEVEIVRRGTSSVRPSLHKVLSPERILALQDLVLRVPAPDHVIRHAVALARATRSRPAPGEKQASAPDFVRENVSFGAGPRASQFLVLGAKARAVLAGRYAASVEDVRALALPTLQHRLVLNFHAESQGISAQEIVRRLVETIKP